MEQAELELQLRVWKDLAISKQVLMRAATDALGLDPECGTEELKASLELAIKKTIEADAEVSKAREQAQLAVSVMDKKTADSEKAQAKSEKVKIEALATLATGEQQMADERTSHANELKKTKAQFIEKDKELKAIKKALADSPQNVLKKLKTLKKQKDEEASARKTITGEATALRKEKRTLTQRVSELKEHLEGAAKLVEQHRELHTQSQELHDQLKPLLDDSKDLAAIPKQDEKLLENIEKAAKSEEK